VRQGVCRGPRGGDRREAEAGDAAAIDVTGALQGIKRRVGQPAGESRTRSRVSESRVRRGAQYVGHAWAGRCTRSRRCRTTGRRTAGRC
jgi:hypothetical protein